MPTPRVTVIMPVYNSENTLHESMQSILGQSYQDFEFIIIDDGSTDATYAILGDYAAQDARIILLRNEQNMRQSYCVNKGLALAQGQYVARMDADDISLPERLAKQVAFMDLHPEVGVCGTWIKFFGSHTHVWRLPVDDDTIRCYMFYDSPVANPTSMVRRHLIVDHQLKYDSQYDPAEDYAFWAEAIKYTTFANLPEVLVHYRVHSSQSSNVRRQAQKDGANRVRLRQVESLGVEVTEATADLHLRVVNFERPFPPDFFAEAEVWIEKLIAANQVKKVFPEAPFAAMLAARWYAIGRTVEPSFSWFRFTRSPMSQYVKLSLIAKSKLLLVTLLPWLRKFHGQA